MILHGYRVLVIDTLMLSVPGRGELPMNASTRRLIVKRLL